jgi:hypothetical protein
MAEVVADASVLIALAQIGQLSLLERLFGQVVVPHAVAREVSPSLPQLPAWVETRAARQPLDARVLDASLDAGETETIAMALELRSKRVILDDLQARRLGERLGLRVIGTAGVLLAAKQRGLIPAVRPQLDALKAAGFRLRQDVHQEVLRAADEGEPEP